MHGRFENDVALRELAEAGALVAYFGYGSLVNRATLRTEIVAARPARATGWRREWQARPGGAADPVDQADISLLTARRDPAMAIDGLLIFDKLENLPRVDLREKDYQRHEIPTGDLSLSGGGVPEGCPIYIYEADPPAEGLVDPPILQSYLDAVLQGFYREHGLDGLKEFIALTGRFDTPVLKDRDWPIYPRAVTLTDDESVLYDGLLAKRGVTYIER